MAPKTPLSPLNVKLGSPLTLENILEFFQYSSQIFFGELNTQYRQVVINNYLLRQKLAMVRGVRVDQLDEKGDLIEGVAGFYMTDEHEKAMRP